MEPVIANVEWVPITLFLCLAVVVVLFLYFRYRSRREAQQTVRAALEKGVQLTPELLQQLGEPQRPRNSDLRRGVIAMSLGIGFAAFGLLVGEEDAVRPFLAIGAFPFVVGVAYLGLWKVRE
jgi:hypothetical protein